VTPAGIVLAIAVAAWGPVAPAIDTAPAAAKPAAATPGAATPAAPLDGAVQPIAPPGPALAGPGSIEPAMIAKAPVDVRARPVFVDAPRRPPAKPLYKNWAFWVISGGAFVAAVVVTIIATRPEPEPYTGNAPPFYVGLP
jgi:hypothetical protein